MLTYIVKLLKALNANVDPGDIAHAVSIGVLLGLMPKNSLLWYMLFVFFLFFKIHKGTYLLILIIFSLTAPVFDALFDTLGYAVLTCKPLESTFAMLLDIPFVGFTKFNNTIVAGSVISGLILYIPFYIIARIFIKVWRARIAPIFQQSKVLRTMYNIPLLGKILELTAGAE